MNILTILKWLKNHKKIAANAFLSALVAFSLLFGVTTCNTNKMLSERLEIAQNNVEAYQDALNGSQQAYNVLQLDMTKLGQQNDKLIQQLDSVRKERKIKAKEVKTAATQTQILYVNNSKEVQGDIISTLRDTIYTDSMQYNNQTKVYYSIGTDSVKILLDVRNTQYLYVYKHKQYKNKKNVLQRLFTLDFKKVYRYKYDIVNSNDLIEESEVRIIESE